MGQRATIALTDNTGATLLTSVQWSTMLHRSLGEALKNVAADQRADAIVEVFAKVTEYEHISSIDTSESAAINAGHGLYIFCPQDCNPTRLKRACSDTDIYEWHLDGNSIGAHYDQRMPDALTFFWSVWDGKRERIETRVVSLADLATFDFEPNYEN